MIFNNSQIKSKFFFLVLHKKILRKNSSLSIQLSFNYHLFKELLPFRITFIHIYYYYYYFVFNKLNICVSQLKNARKKTKKNFLCFLLYLIKYELIVIMALQKKKKLLKTKKNQKSKKKKEEEENEEEKRGTHFALCLELQYKE